MTAERGIAEQIARLLQGYPGVVWELVTAPGPAHCGDVVIRDEHGILVAYARPAQRDVGPQVDHRLERATTRSPAPLPPSPPGAFI